MASASKVGWSQLKVGILAIFSLVLLGILIFLLTGSKKPFSRDEYVYTYMDDASTLAQGVAVRLNGIVVGELEAVGLSGERAEGRVIKLTMAIQRDMMEKIPADSQVTLSAENVLGTKFINIRTGRAARTVQPGGTLPARMRPDFDDVVESGNQLLASLDLILGRVNKIVEQVEVGKGSIGKLLVDEELYNRLVASVAEVQKLTVALNSDRGTLGKLIYDPALYNQLSGSLQRVDGLIADLQSGQGTAGKLLKDPALYDESQKTIAELRKLTEDLNAGKGTAGKLLKDEQIANQLNATIAKVNVTIDRLNAGQGTIGQLLVNQQLYDSLNGTTGELQGLLKDFRANPKKFLRIKLALF